MSCSGGHLGYAINNKKWKCCKGWFNDYLCIAWVESSFLLEYSYYVINILHMQFLRRCFKFQTIRKHNWPLLSSQIDLKSHKMLITIPEAFLPGMVYLANSYFLRKNFEKKVYIWPNTKSWQYLTWLIWARWDKNIKLHLK